MGAFMSQKTLSKTFFTNQRDMNCLFDSYQQIPWTEHEKYYTFSLCKYYNKLTFFI